MNTRTIIKIGFIWYSILLSIHSFGQGELPLGALPMLYNGSFAGETGGPRISSNFYLQTANRYYSPSNEYHLYTSYDQFIPAIRSGIGITAGFGGGYSTPYSSSTDKFSDKMISGAVAPKLSINGKYTLSPSLDFTYSSVILDYTWGSYFDTLQPEFNGKHEYVQSRAGILFNTNKFYIGYSVYLLDQATYKNVTYTKYRDNFNSILQLGYTFQRHCTSKFSFTPQVAFRIYKTKKDFLGRNWVKINFLEGFNLNFRYKQFIWGITNAGIHLGWQTDKLKLMVSGGISSSSFAGNLSFRYVIQNKYSKKYVSAPN